MMKLNKLTVLTASIFLASSVAAHAGMDKDLSLPKAKQVTKFNHVKSDFGSYVVKRDLAYIPATIADANNVISSNGSMAIVKANAPVDRVGKGTLVRNTLTNEISPLSGNISVLLKSGVTANDVSSATGLDIVSAYAGTQIAVLRVTGEQDLIEARKQLKSSGLVKVAKIEVLEVLHKAE